VKDIKNSKIHATVLEYYKSLSNATNKLYIYVSPQEKTIPSSLKTHITNYGIDVQPGLISLDSPGPITDIIRTFSSKIRNHRITCPLNIEFYQEYIIYVLNFMYLFKVIDVIAVAIVRNVTAVILA